MGARRNPDRSAKKIADDISRSVAQSEYDLVSAPGGSRPSDGGTTEGRPPGMTTPLLPRSWSPMWPTSARNIERLADASEGFHSRHITSKNRICRPNFFASNCPILERNPHLRSLVYRHRSMNKRLSHLGKRTISRLVAHMAIEVDSLGATALVDLGARSHSMRCYFVRNTRLQGYDPDNVEQTPNTGSMISLPLRIGSVAMRHDVRSDTDRLSASHPGLIGVGRGPGASGRCRFTSAASLRCSKSATDIGHFQDADTRR